MPRTQNDVAVRLAATGDEDVKRRLQALGRDGQAALAKLEKGGLGSARGLLAVDSASRDLQGRAAGYASRLGPLGSALSALGPAGIAAAAGIAGLSLGLNAALARTREAVEFADNIAKTADVIGLGVEALQEYRFAASQAGIEAAAFDTAAIRLTRTIGDAANGQKEMAAAFRELGVELRDAEGRIRSTDAVLLDIADGIAQVGDEATRARLLAKLFGEDAGPKFANLVGRGSAALKEQRQEARALGGVFDAHLVRQLAKAKEEMREVSTVADVQLNTALAGLTPVLILKERAWAALTTTMRRAADALHDIEGKSIYGLNEEMAALTERLNENARALAGLNQGPPDDVDDAVAGSVVRATREAAINKLLDERNKLIAEQARIRGVLNEHEKAAQETGAGAGGDAGAGLPATVSALAKYLQQLEQEGQLLQFTGREREIQIALLKAETAARQDDTTVTAEQQAAIRAAIGARLDHEQALKNEAEATARATAGAVAEERARAAAFQRSEALLTARQLVTHELHMEAEAARMLRDLAGEDERTRRIEIELLDVRNRFRATGIGLMGEEEVQWRALIAAQVDAEIQAEQYQETLKFVQQSGERAFDRIGSAITTMIVQGKEGTVEFRNLWHAMLSEMLQSALEFAAINPLKNALFGGGGGGGGIFGQLLSAGANILLGGFGGGGLALASVPGGGGLYHGGGIVGRDRVPTRAVPAGLFASAPRLHGGGMIAPDEVPIIARRGEGVFTSEQMAAMGRPMVNLSVTIENNATGATVRAEMRGDPFGGRELRVIVDEMVGQAISSPGMAQNAVLDLVHSGAKFRPFSR